MFSSFLNIILQKIVWYWTIVKRFSIILFRKNRRIKLLYLKYNSEHVFDNGFLIVNYRFRNALYYKFGNHITLEKQIKIFNLKNFDHEFQLTVYGFFQKKTFKLKVEPKSTLHTNNFKTTISNITVELKEQKTTLNQASVILTLDEPKIIYPKIKIETNSFNQNEFI